MNEILKLLLSDKGRDANRTLVLLGIAWVVWQTHEIERHLARVETRVAVVESRLGTASTNHLAGLPAWRP